MSSSDDEELTTRSGGGEDELEDQEPDEAGGDDDDDGDDDDGGGEEGDELDVGDEALDLEDGDADMLWGDELEADDDVEDAFEDAALPVDVLAEIWARVGRASALTAVELLDGDGRGDGDAGDDQLLQALPVPVVVTAVQEPVGLANVTLERWKLNLVASSPDAKLLFVAEERSIAVFRLNARGEVSVSASLDEQGGVQLAARFMTLQTPYANEEGACVINSIRCSVAGERAILSAVDMQAQVTIWLVDALFEPPLCIDNREPDIEDNSCWSLAHAPAGSPGTRLAVGSNTTLVTVVDVEEALRRSSRLNLALSDDASGGDDAQQRRFPEAIPACRTVIRPCHDHNVPFVNFHPGGNHLATCSIDKTVRVWSLSPPQCLAAFVPTDDPAALWGWSVCWVDPCAAETCALTLDGYNDRVMRPQPRARNELAVRRFRRVVQSQNPDMDLDDPLVLPFLLPTVAQIMRSIPGEEPEDRGVDEAEQGNGADAEADADANADVGAEAEAEAEVDVHVRPGVDAAGMARMDEEHDYRMTSAPPMSACLMDIDDVADARMTVDSASSSNNRDMLLVYASQRALHLMDPGDLSCPNDAAAGVGDDGDSSAGAGAPQPALIRLLHSISDVASGTLVNGAMAIDRLSFLEYIPELSVVVVASQGASSVLIFRVTRFACGQHGLIFEQRVPRNADLRSSPLAGVCIAPVRPSMPAAAAYSGSVDALTSFRLYLLFLDATVRSFQLRRRPDVNPRSLVNLLV